MEELIILNIDSRFRNRDQFKNAGKYTYELLYPIKNVMSIRMSSIEVPNIFYTFTNQKKNNQFAIKFNDTIEYIFIQDGNYGVDQILIEISEKLDSINTKYMQKFSISINTINGKVTIKNENKFSLIFDKKDKYTVLGDHLGFAKNEYNGNNVYTAEGIIDIIDDQYIFLKINDYGNLITQLNDRNILAKIIVNKNKNTIIFDNFSNFITKSYKFEQPHTLNKLHIELFDAYGNTVSLNNMNFSMTLELIISSVAESKLDELFIENFNISQEQEKNHITRGYTRQLEYSTYVNNQNNIPNNIPNNILNNQVYNTNNSMFNYMTMQMNQGYQDNQNNQNNQQSSMYNCNYIQQ
jgi:hypothetical protein